MTNSKARVICSEKALGLIIELRTARLQPAALEVGDAREAVLQPLPFARYR